MKPLSFNMQEKDSLQHPSITRRRFFKAAMGASAGLALYAGEIERHWIEITRRDVHIPGLTSSFNGLRIAQMSDIHMDEFTEPFFLRHAVDRINSLNPDLVLLTGDFVSNGVSTTKFAIGAGWQCANLLAQIKCKQVIAVLGNHDFLVEPDAVTAALKANGITVLRNDCMPIERGGSRFWLSGLEDPVEGRPDPDRAIPTRIRNVPYEPVVLMCHAPDYADFLVAHPAGKAIDLMLSGHTHGGQVRVPFLGAMELPELGKKYVEGWFRFDRLQLYVNRGVGAVGLPFRFNCPPEITVFTMHSA